MLLIRSMHSKSSFKGWHSMYVYSFFVPSFSVKLQIEIIEAYNKKANPTALWVGSKVRGWSYKGTTIRKTKLPFWDALTACHSVRK